MKNTLILFLLAITACKAQSPVVSLLENPEYISGAYYKDTYNDFDKFIGTWKYQSGNESFTIVLQKREMYYEEFGNTYSDMLVGEYRYIDESGNEVVNTLSNLNLTNLKPFENSIAGELILDGKLPVAQRRVQLKFTDPEREYLKRYIILKRIEGVIPQKIEVRWQGNMSIAPDENSPTEVRVPQEVYILEKQP